MLGTIAVLPPCLQMCCALTVPRNLGLQLREESEAAAIADARVAAEVAAAREKLEAQLQEQQVGGR